MTLKQVNTFFAIAVLVLNCLLFQCYAVEAIEDDTKVSCRSNLSCSSEADDVIGLMTARECCVGNPNGLAYTNQQDNQTCTVCIVFGFFQDSFVGTEQRSGYTMKIGYQKGAAQAERNLVLKVEDSPGTASSVDDYTLNTGQVSAFYQRPDSPYLLLILHLDDTAQEPDETLSLHLSQLPETLPTGDGVFFRSSMNITIIDSNTVEIAFTEGDYRANERSKDGEGNLSFMPVKVTKTPIRIATPIVLEVIPLTVQQANYSRSFVDNPYSPSFADLEDFSNASIRVIFNPDEDNSLNELNVPIPIFDDDVDEADEQLFVIKLRLVSAVNADTISITRDTSLCKIVDNDVIRLGFELPAYTYTEPMFEETVDSSYLPKSTSLANGPVYIVKENNKFSEQTFQIFVQVATGLVPSGQDIQPATVNTDYRFSVLSHMVLQFLPGQQKLNVPFTLLHDDLTERSEAFLLTMTPKHGMQFKLPTFSVPINLSVESFVIIEDLDKTTTVATTTESSHSEATSTAASTVREASDATTDLSTENPDSFGQTTDTAAITSSGIGDESTTTSSKSSPEGGKGTPTFAVTSEQTEIPSTSVCNVLREDIDDILITTDESQGLTLQDMTKAMDQLADVVTDTESDISLCSANETRSSFNLISQIFSNIAKFLLNEPTTDKIQLTNRIVSVSTKVVNSLLEWPTESVDAEASSRLIKSFEIITSLYTRHLKNESSETFFFSSITLVTGLHGIEQLQETGKSFRADDTREFNVNSEKSESSLSASTPPSSTSNSSIVLPSAVFDKNLSRTNTNNTIGIVFTLYKTTTLFPVGARNNTDVTTTQVGTHIISANVGEHVKDLKEPVTVNLQLYIKEGEFLMSGSAVCVSWDFNLHDWTDSGCKTTVGKNGNVTCSCNHLTNFAVLMDVCLRQEDCQPVNKHVDTFLSYVSYIGIAISIVGLTLTIITLLAFKEIRKRETSKYHIQLSIALLLMLIMTLVLVATSAQAAEMLYGGCVTISVLVHYFALVAVMWMGAEALLMFQKVVIIFVRITTKFIIAVSLVCWLLPIVPVVIPLAVDMVISDDPEDDLIVKRNGTDSFCFLFHPGAFWGAFLGPILLILTLNIISFVCVLFVLIRQVKRRKAMYRSGSMKRKISTVSNQMKDEPANTGMGYKKTIFLMIRITGVMALFGLSWLFAILTVVSVKGLQEMFQILFTVFNSFQGCFIFIFLCLLDKRVRRSWKRLYLKIKSRITGKKYPELDSTMTSRFGMHSRDSTRSRSFRLTTVNSTTDIVCPDTTLPSTSSNGKL